MSDTPTTPLSVALKAATAPTHGVLDQRIMAFNPFAGREHYAAFLQMQYRFHRDVDALFSDPELNRLLPGLSERRRFHQVAQDLADLGLTPSGDDTPPAFVPGAAVDVPGALGWLYTEEGSNLGGAFLFKLAARIGFDENQGARHLAPHPEGRAPSWKAFVAQLDAVPLDADGRARAAAGAQAAFARVLGHVEACCPLPVAQGTPA
ncbi:biliverdin-producing heme oxygenase [Hydrogenophaga palleronii]|uniref:biliverdin-producing heme oxygenase n=1 Tax=Hydrogenophaga palleronii TaxID=65655 RepID=UPI000825CB90|nr:biliverdin-producing heme oxygenase [Hydrogenophaga palleronii]